MFQLIMGSLLLVFTVGLFIKYQPRTFSSWYVCLLCGLMAVVSMITGGNSWILQLVQTSSQLMIAACSLFHLHREKVFAVRKAKVVMAQHGKVKRFAQKQQRVPVQVRKQNKIKAQKEVRQQVVVPMERCA